MYHNRGFTFIGLLFWLTLIILAVALVIRLGPSYYQNYAITSAIKEMAQDPNLVNFSREKLRDDFIKQLQVNDIRNIAPEALKIENASHSARSLVLNYEVREHLIANIDCVLIFNERVPIP